MDSLTILMQGMATLAAAIIAGFYIDYIAEAKSAPQRVMAPNLVPMYRNDQRVRRVS
jgi:hypothetical protein